MSGRMKADVISSETWRFRRGVAEWSECRLGRSIGTDKLLSPSLALEVAVTSPIAEAGLAGISLGSFRDDFRGAADLDTLRRVLLSVSLEV